MAITLSLAAPPVGHLRPLNILRDLPAVADLIELCFHNTMDAEGRSYLENLRRSAQDGGFLHWAMRAVDTASLPLSGFVWEEDGRIIGNVSIIPYNKAGRRIYLLANIATHPEARRRGIARRLTGAAMQAARDRKASSLWLHVRDDNPGAIHLYESLGFEERMRRASWVSVHPAAPAAPAEPGGYSFLRRSSRDWTSQALWLERLYPAALFWYHPQHWEILRPGVINSLRQFLSDSTIDHWSAYLHGRLQAVVDCQHGWGARAHLWAAVPPEGGEAALGGLLAHIRRQMGSSVSMSLDFQAGLACDALQAAGFQNARTLLWMEADGAQPARC